MIVRFAQHKNYLIGIAKNTLQMYILKDLGAREFISDDAVHNLSTLIQEKVLLRDDTREPKMQT